MQSTIAPKIENQIKTLEVQLERLKTKQNNIGNIDSPPERVLNVKEIAQFLKKSERWVYRHWKKLGGIKFEGTIFFLSLEVVYGAILRQGEWLEVPVQKEGDKASKQVFQDKKSGNRGRGHRQKGLGEKTPDGGDDLHNLRHLINKAIESR